MINARIYTDKVPYVVLMDGHAGAKRDENDRDLVCCAASFSLQAFARWMERNHHGRISGTAEPGYTRMAIHPYEGHVMAVKKRLAYMEDELKTLQEEHPECVAVSTNK